MEVVLSSDAPYGGCMQFHSLPGITSTCWQDAPVELHGKFTDPLRKRWNSPLRRILFAKTTKQNSMHVVGKDIIYRDALFWHCHVEGSRSPDAKGHILAWNS